MKTAYYAHQATGGTSAGNGSLMRCLPVALYYNDVEKMLEVTASQSILTHYDQKYPEYKLVFQLLKDQLKPTGYVVDTLICTLWCFINISSFEDAVCEAANLGGHADTIAAITGGMAGVYYGYDAIPERWKEKILVKKRLTSIAKRMIEKYRIQE